MNNLKRNLKIFFLFSKFSLKTTTQGRLGPILFVIGKLLRFIMLFSLIFIIFSKTRLIKGYTLNQVILFYLTFNLIDTITQIFFREVYRFRPLVLSGNLDLVLTKPYHPFLRVLVGGVDYLDVLILIPYTLLTSFFIYQSNNRTIEQLAVYLLLVFNAIIIATAFHIIVLALGILTTEVDHAIMIYRDITALGRFPMNIYSEPIRSIFTFIIPVGIMITFPVHALLNLLSSTFYLLAFLVSLTLFVFSLKLWNYALKKYQSWGG